MHTGGNNHLGSTHTIYSYGSPIGRIRVDAQYHDGANPEATDTEAPTKGSYLVVLVSLSDIDADPDDDPLYLTTEAIESSGQPPLQLHVDVNGTRYDADNEKAQSPQGGWKPTHDAFPHETSYQPPYDFGGPGELSVSQGATQEGSAEYDVPRGAGYVEFDYRDASQPGGSLESDESSRVSSNKFRWNFDTSGSRCNTVLSTTTKTTAAPATKIQCPSVEKLQDSLPAGAGIISAPSVECSGDYAVAGVTDNTQNEFVQLFHQQQGAWAPVDREGPCAAHDVPAKLYETVCESG